MGHRRTAISYRSLLRSAAAGAVAVWVMDRFDWFVFDHEDPQARQHAEPGFAARPDRRHGTILGGLA